LLPDEEDEDGRLTGRDPATAGSKETIATHELAEKAAELRYASVALDVTRPNTPKSAPIGPHRGSARSLHQFPTF
jgi:hypothetical protein